MGGEPSAHGEFSLDGWIGKAVGRLDLHQARRAAVHLDKEVGDNVAGPGILLPPARRVGRAIEELNLVSCFFALPRVPDSQGLLFDQHHPRTSNEDHSRSRLELPLAADRTSLFRTGHEDERTGRAPAQAERGEVRSFIQIGHGSFLGRDDARNVATQAALRRVLEVPLEVRGWAGDCDPEARLRLVRTVRRLLVEAILASTSAVTRRSQSSW
jgi:hypothetical protein